MSEERRITEGAVKLKPWIKLHYGSVPKFCDAHGFDRIQLQRVLNGERWARISVDFAVAIERATNGDINHALFLSETAVPPPPDSGEVPPVTAGATGTHEG